MKIIAIGAHLDDIEFGCAGTLAKAVERGHEVLMVVMSHSGYKDYNGIELRTRDVALDEGKEAAKIIGAKLIVMNFETKDVPYNSKSVEAINKILDNFKPDIILTHWVHDTHQDHRNTSLATISAARYFNSILMWEPMMPSGRSYHGFRAQVYVNISDTIEKKMTSLAAHKSQVKKYGSNCLDSVRGRALLHGYEMNNTYAEVFEIVRYEMKIT
jgi:LmbE family N-acetylglucosaminyl deacetylase